MDNKQHTCNSSKDFREHKREIRRKRKRKQKGERESNK